MFINTELFKTEAREFVKKGFYNRDPFGSPAWFDYWTEQLRRCTEGYSVGGVKITGDHYGYLNFNRIKLTTDDRQENVTKKRIIGKKILTFPDFWDGDYEYFWIKEIARNGISEENYNKLGLSVKIKLEHLVGGKNLCVAKARRKGFSYKNSWIATNVYNTIKNSVSIIAAYEKKYLYPKGTMSMVSDNLDFLNEFTGWAKKRDFINIREHKRASYKFTDERGNIIEKGFKSEVIALSFMDNPDAARGKDANLVLIEEGGVFDNLKASYSALEPLTRSGTVQTGQIILFGCVCAGTKVWTNSGKLINIEDLKKEDGILGFNNQTASKEEITYLKPPAKKPCYKITTNTGRILECSEDHPIIWSNNHFWHRQKESKTRDYLGQLKKVIWKETKDIKIGDHIGIMNAIPIFGTKKLWEPRLIGMLIGDGSYGFNKTPILSNCDIEINDYISSKYNTEIEKEYITLDGRIYKETRIKDICKNLRDIGIYGQTKDKKTLPKDIYDGDKESICELIGGLIDTDGYINHSKKNKIQIILTSAYKNLLLEVKDLCTKLGIHGSIYEVKVNTEKEKKIKDISNYYRFIIGDNVSLYNFYKNIKLLIKKKQDRIDLIPKIYKENKKLKGTVFIKQNSKNKNRVDITDVKGVRFEIVKSLEFLGEKDVYNLTAGTTHTYIANGIITHNTGGDMEKGTVDFEDMFYDPESYNMIAVENKWDEDLNNTFCSYYFPDKKNKDGFIDKDGNSDEDGAEQYEQIKRELLRKTAKDKKVLDRHIVEYSNKPKETFLRIKGNIFPIIDLQKILGTLEGKKDEQNYWIGNLIQNVDGKIEWEADSKLSPILDFPIKDKTRDTTGCVIIYEQPLEYPDGIPHGMYIAGIDPYDHDKSKTGSLGSTLIYNRLTKKIVAEYTARPETSKDYYEIVRRLLLYYNARALYENEKKGIFDYFEYKNCEYLLADQPLCIKDVIPSSKVNRNKGMHMSTELKDYGEGLIKTYLIEQYNNESPDILNMHKIRSQGLLKELIAYDGEINTDRVMAFMMLMYYLLELRKYKFEEKKDNSKKIQNSKFFDLMRFRNK